VSLPIRDEHLEIRELFSEELLLALPPRHPLARKRAVTVPELRGERLIVMKEGHCLGDQVLGFCERRNVKSKISFRSAQLETIRALITAKLGISLIPKMATHGNSAHSLEYRSLQSPKPERKIVAVWPKHRALTRAANEFLKLVTTKYRKSASQK
jgi:LysR family hydrogen peroxide-inducible transcriptional activator